MNYFEKARELCNVQGELYQSHDVDINAECFAIGNEYDAYMYDRDNNVTLLYRGNNPATMYVNLQNALREHSSLRLFSRWDSLHGKYLEQDNMKKAEECFYQKMRIVQMYQL